MRRSKTSLASLFFICLIATTSCSDDNSELQTPSTVDTKTWTGDKYMNPNVKPGDNFAMYCWGTWYDNTPLGNETSVGLWESEAYPCRQRKNEAECSAGNTVEDGHESID